MQRERYQPAGMWESVAVRIFFAAVPGAVLAQVGRAPSPPQAALAIRDFALTPGAM
jgi:hypothetical protein